MGTFGRCLYYVVILGFIQITATTMSKSKRLKSDILECGHVVPVWKSPFPLHSRNLRESLLPHLTRCPEFGIRNCTLKFQGRSKALRMAFELCIKKNYINVIKSCETTMTISYSGKMKQFNCRNLPIHEELCADVNEDLEVNFESNSNNFCSVDSGNLIAGTMNVILKPVFRNTINLISDLPCPIETSEYSGTIVYSHPPQEPGKGPCAARIILGGHYGSQFCMQFGAFRSHTGGASLSVRSSIDGLFVEYNDIGFFGPCVSVSKHDVVTIKVEPGTDRSGNRFALDFFIEYFVHGYEDFSIDDDDDEEDYVFDVRLSDLCSYALIIIFLALLCCSCCFYRRITSGMDSSLEETDEDSQSAAPMPPPANARQFNAVPTRPMGHFTMQSRGNGESYPVVVGVGVGVRLGSEPWLPCPRTVVPVSLGETAAPRDSIPEDETLSNSSEPPSYQSLFPDK